MTKKKEKTTIEETKTSHAEKPAIPLPAPESAAKRSDPADESEFAFPANMPVMPLREMVVFPNMAVPLNIGRKKGIQLVDDVLNSNTLFVNVLQKSDDIEDPGENDVYRHGTIVSVAKMLRMPDDSIQLIVHGVARCRIDRFTQGEPYLRADITPLKETPVDPQDVESQALVLNLQKSYQRFSELAQNIPQEFSVMVLNLQEPGRLADVMSTIGNIPSHERQEVLVATDVKERLKLVSRIVARMLEVFEVGNKIQSQIKDEMSKGQREYLLREQMKALQKELGEKDEKTVEVEEFREKIDNAKMSEEGLKAANRELDRLMRMPPAAAEYTVSRTYLEWLTELPWAVSSDDNLDLKSVAKVLDNDHYGLEKVKSRILEFLAVRKLKPDMKSPILCFVGPPGVGKTSLGMSIANAMGRKFIRMSLGGVRDEAEIRGHRRTYVASMPGRIIQSIKKAKSSNPVFLMDEIDKMGSDWRGDPAAALLEVLDPEQNSEFMDHFLDVPFDISKVMFVATANTLWGIPVSLRDRLEIIEFNGYTHNEKIAIARQFLIPKQLREHGLGEDTLKLDNAAIDAVIRGYTREAGVRNLDREFATLCRRAARKVVEKGLKKVQVTCDNLHEYLGIPKFLREENAANGVGLASGLAWTENGGEVLAVEAVSVPGKGALLLTGKLGDVMKESAQAAFSYIKSKELVPAAYIQAHNLHIHIPEGAIPKDGPSAGITLAAALASLLTGRAVKKGLSMTGEITLTGRVLAIGGLKEKIIASFREEIYTVLFPRVNEKELEDVPDEIKSRMKLIPVASMDEVLELALEKKKQGPGSVKPKKQKVSK